MNLIALAVGGVFLLVLISGSSAQRAPQPTANTSSGGRLAGGLAFAILVPVILLLALGVMGSAPALSADAQPSSPPSAPNSAPLLPEAPAVVAEPTLELIPEVEILES